MDQDDEEDAQYDAYYKQFCTDAVSENAQYQPSEEDLLQPEIEEVEIVTNPNIIPHGNEGWYEFTADGQWVFYSYADGFEFPYEDYYLNGFPPEDLMYRPEPPLSAEEEQLLLQQAQPVLAQDGLVDDAMNLFRLVPPRVQPVNEFVALPPPPSESDLVKQQAIDKARVQREEQQRAEAAILAKAGIVRSSSNSSLHSSSAPSAANGPPSSSMNRKSQPSSLLQGEASVYMAYRAAAAASSASQSAAARPNTPASRR
jgi:hypothetical protein